MKWFIIALLFFASTCFTADLPSFKQTEPIEICVFENGYIFPCFNAEMDGEEVLVLFDNAGKVFAIVQVKDGEVVKTLWLRSWVSI